MESQNPYSQPPGEFVRSMLRRSRKNDYRSKRIYLITLNKSAKIEALSRIIGNSVDDARVEITEAGHIFLEALKQILDRNRMLSVLNLTVMPDHVHVLLRVNEYMEQPLGFYIRHLKTACTIGYREYLIGKGLYTEGESLPFFEKGFHDRICSAEGQRQRMYEYVRDNPRRRWVIMQNHDFFTRLRRIEMDGKPIAAYGNLFLLDEPEISVVRFSRRFSEAEFAAMRETWMGIAKNGGVLVSPFIHQEERKIREEAVALGAKIIHVRPNGFREKHKPMGRDFDLCAEGRLLEIAPAEWRKEWETGSRRLFMNMNGLAERLADYAHRHGGLRQLFAPRR